MDNFEFVACRRTAKLVKYTGTVNRVVIPAVFEGKPVTEIGPGAFAKNQLEAIVLPPTIEVIDVNAFGWARNLAYIGAEIPEGEIPEMSVLPAAVRYIGTNAFDWNFAMRKLTILGDEVEVDDYAFASSNMEEVYLPNCTDLKLGTGVFAHCANLTKISAPKANVGMVPACCFEGCHRLRTADFIFSAVGHDAFHGCRELTKIRLPKVLTYKEPNAFTGCDHLVGRRTYIK